MLTVTIHSITWGEQVWVHLLPSFMPFFNLNKVLEVGPKSRFSLEKKKYSDSLFSHNIIFISCFQLHNYNFTYLTHI